MTKENCKEFSAYILPIGTVGYTMHGKEIWELKITNVVIKPYCDFRLVEYDAQAVDHGGTFSFKQLQPKDSGYDENDIVPGFYETKEKCAEAFLKSLGLKIDASIQQIK